MIWKSKTHRWDLSVDGNIIPVSKNCGLEIERLVDSLMVQPLPTENLPNDLMSFVQDLELSSQAASQLQEISAFPAYIDALRHLKNFCDDSLTVDDESVSSAISRAIRCDDDGRVAVNLAYARFDTRGCRRCLKPGRRFYEAEDGWPAEEYCIDRECYTKRPAKKKRFG